MKLTRAAGGNGRGGATYRMGLLPAAAQLNRALSL
jgi:hypothetical protein